MTNDPTGIDHSEPINESIEGENKLMKVSIKGKKEERCYHQVSEW